MSDIVWIDTASWKPYMEVEPCPECEGTKMYEQCDHILASLGLDSMVKIPCPNCKEGWVIK